MANTPVSILVVEDHRDTASMYTRLLSREGYRTTVADGFRSAVVAAQGQRFQVVLCDVGLPDGDGCALLAELRALYPVKAVAVTGYGMPADLARFETAGFDRLLVKPVDFERLVQAIADITSSAPDGEADGPPVGKPQGTAP